ncbi:AAA family ATPase [Bifidobacterium catulorum]|uniref:AAA family ATPase n=1 Tax=Bifidobacterium catulorum TaxID=1630173 RepID=A0A2U2MSI0_9BIFI|nr:MoxR family ATPase [Bifidobacterium catulorum]PWG59818.1 AAA family ATPase [Bifidobacterium catulorum]
MALFPPRPSQQPAVTPAPAVSPSSSAVSRDDLERVRDLTNRIRRHFAQGLVAQDQLRESLIATMVAGGHILIESVPGLAKTTAAQILATSVSGSFKRIQCTPDLMPSDLVGTQIFDFATQKMTTQIGPIHANFVLLDEINRSSAKTQSAMLEAMAEGAATIGGERIRLPRPFMVIATQNPIEEEGTYNLPEAQMDRFYMKTVMTYPSETDEISMLDLLTRRGTDQQDATVSPAAIGIADVEFLRSCARRVHVSQPIMKYAVELAQTSRGAGPRPIKGLSNLVRLGASPRASIALVRIGQAQALMSGRDYVIPEDVKAFAHEVFRHRILLTFEAMAEGVDADQVIDSMIEAVPVP